MKNKLFSSQIEVKINQTIETRDEILSRVKENDCCVFWYVGSYGLKPGAIDFYKPMLTEVIKQNARNFLVDLTAWAGFKSAKLTKFSDSSKTNKLTGDKVDILSCKDFFEQLIALKDESDFCKFIQEIAMRKELLEPSEKFAPINLSIAERFANNCPALSPIYDYDCAKTYSLIQYIEFMFFIKEIVNRSDDLKNIRFILPNDEAKYYTASLAKDLDKFLSLSEIKLSQPLHIYIDCFKYSDTLEHRPYNAPGKSVKKAPGYEDIIDKEQLVQDIKVEAAV
jgi:hypothetical protein